MGSPPAPICWATATYERLTMDGLKTKMFDAIRAEAVRMPSGSSHHLLKPAFTRPPRRPRPAYVVRDAGEVMDGRMYPAFAPDIARAECTTHPNSRQRQTACPL